MQQPNHRRHALLNHRHETFDYAVTFDGLITMTASGALSSTGTLVLSADIASLHWDETDAAADEARWRMSANGGAWSFFTLNDVENAGTAIFQVERTGYAIDELSFGNDTDDPNYIFQGTGDFTADGLHGSGGNLCSGVYSPTFTNNVNVASSSGSVARFMRVGQVVTVAGRVQITATAGATVLSLGISLPIASAIAATSEVSGTGARQDSGSNMPCTIGGDATNDRASLVFLPENTSAYDYNYHFTYVIN